MPFTVQEQPLCDWVCASAVSTICVTGCVHQQYQQQSLATTAWSGGVEWQSCMCFKCCTGHIRHVGKGWQRLLLHLPTRASQVSSRFGATARSAHRNCTTGDQVSDTTQSSHTADRTRFSSKLNLWVLSWEHNWVHCSPAAHQSPQHDACLTSLPLMKLYGSSSSP